MSELVSILIPAYNAGSWIADTIRSATAQTWPHTEVIVVDDGSKDGTLQVARSFASRTVKVVTQQNSGAPAARNAAFELAQGAFVQWLDADDLLDPDKITRQMRVAREVADPLVLLSCPFGTFHYRPDKAVFARTSLWSDLQPIQYFLNRFNDNACFQTDAWLASRELTEATGPWATGFGGDDDGEYFCRMVMRSHGVKFVPEARSYYRVGNFGSLSQGISKPALLALFRAKKQCIEYLISLEDSPRTRAASVALLQEWLPYFYPDHMDIVEDARALALALGGELSPPVLKGKYRPAEWVLGYGAAVKLSRIAPRIRATAARTVDKCLYEAVALLASAKPQVHDLK